MGKQSNKKKSAAAGNHAQPPSPQARTDDGKKVTSEKKEKPANCCCCKREDAANYSRWQRFINWVKKASFADAAIAFLTLVLAVIGAIQAGIYSSQLRTMRVDDQAFIKMMPEVPGSDGVPDKDWRLPVEAGKEVDAPIKIGNIGKTIAKDVKVWIRIEKLSIYDGPDFKNKRTDRRPGMTTGVIFPNDTPVKFAARWANIVGDEDVMATPSPDDVTAWKLGKIYFSAYGIVTYNDIFNVPHWETFCTAFTGDGTQAPGSRECIKTGNSVDNP